MSYQLPDLASQVIANPLPVVWHWFMNFLGSDFFVALAASGAGAWAGAAVVQRIIEKEKKKAALLAEIRGINAAISLTIVILNSVINLKKQFVLPFSRVYELQRLGRQLHRLGIVMGAIPPTTQYEVEFDMRTLPPINLPISALQDFIYEKTSLSGRILNLFSVLHQTSQGLDISIRRRNELIEGYKAGSPVITPNLYFGLAFGGVINEDYPSTLWAIHNQTDHLLYFSNKLCLELSKHGDAQANIFNKLYRDAPIINKLVQIHDGDQKLIPSAYNYPDWEKMFGSTT